MQQKPHHMEGRSRAQMSERGTPQHQEAVSGIMSFWVQISSHKLRCLRKQLCPFFNNSIIFTLSLISLNDRNLDLPMFSWRRISQIWELIWYQGIRGASSVDNSKAIIKYTNNHETILYNVNDKNSPPSSIFSWSNI